jgi:hypothetical protein
MLERLLAEIRQGGTLPSQILASRLNISRELVEMMLEDLARRGLLSQLNTECSSTCGGCPVTDFCATQGNPKGRVWMLASQPVK